MELGQSISVILLNVYGINSAIKRENFKIKAYAAYKVFASNMKTHKLWKENSAITNQKIAKIVILI